MGPRYGRQLAKIGVVIEHQLVPKSEAVLSPIVRCASKSPLSSVLRSSRVTPAPPSRHRRHLLNHAQALSALSRGGRVPEPEGFALFKAPS